MTACGIFGEKEIPVALRNRGYSAVYAATVKFSKEPRD